MNDAELIESSWSRAEAFTALFDEHFSAVYAFCARRVGAWDGEEAAGETFVRAFANRHTYDLAQPNARPWLFGIARNVVRERLRSRGREDAVSRRLSGSDGVEPVDPAGSAATALDARRDLAAVARALTELPAEEVETLLLHVWEGLSYIEAARALAVPVGTVRSRLNRVRRRLRDILDGDPSVVATKTFSRRLGDVDE